MENSQKIYKLLADGVVSPEKLVNDLLSYIPTDILDKFYEERGYDMIWNDNDFLKNENDININNANKIQKEEFFNNVFNECSSLKNCGTCKIQRNSKEHLDM